MDIKRKVSLFAAWIALCVLLVCAAVPAKAAGETCTSEDTAAQIVREAMVNREAGLEITYPIERVHLNEEEIMALVQRIYDKAIDHTGVGTEGDYLYFHESQFQYGYEYTDDRISSSVDVKLTFGFSYYTDSAQEAQLAAEVDAVLSALKLGGKNEYEKAKAIYDYICENVKYDHDNLNNEAYKLKYSAYAALCNGTSVCQGYANLFYRLANEAGLDARIVSGTSRGQNHAWNIVRVDGKYYNIDSTWDAGRDAYNYFLKGSANFDEHTPGGEHPANYSSYDISATDYMIPIPETSTEAPTEATTEELTEAPTEATTEELTEAPTEATTEELTEAPTEATTEELTEAPTEATTEELTETSTEATTEELTEAPTETTTEESTEAPTEATTEELTEAPTETTTEELTEAPTEASTEEPTETPARPSTETTTKAPGETKTEAVSETETETLGDCGMPDDPIPTESSADDEPKENPKGKVIYLIVGVAGVVVAGTGVMVGRVILKKRNAK